MMFLINFAERRPHIQFNKTKVIISWWLHLQFLLIKETNCTILIKNNWPSTHIRDKNTKFPHILSFLNEHKDIMGFYEDF